jgi:hypothetical protein
MEDLGYDTHNSMLLLGTVGVALFYWILEAIICLILKFIVIKYPNNKWLKKQ